jgi:hypothetical protein
MVPAATFINQLPAAGAAAGTTTPSSPTAVAVIHPSSYKKTKNTTGHEQKQKKLKRSSEAALSVSLDGSDRGLPRPRASSYHQPRSPTAVAVIHPSSYKKPKKQQGISRNKKKSGQKHRNQKNGI